MLDRITQEMVEVGIGSLGSDDNRSSTQIVIDLLHAVARVQLAQRQSVPATFVAQTLKNVNTIISQIGDYGLPGLSLRDEDWLIIRDVLNNAMEQADG